MDDRLDNAVSQWTRIGAMFAASPSAHTPDLERLLLETARLAPAMARLFIMAATWLHRYPDLVATHRLRRLVRDELEPQHRAALALLLDLASQDAHPPRFAGVLRGLTPEAHPRPLFDTERATTPLAERARRRASQQSLHWGLWCEEIQFKLDAIRPARWLMRHNPTFIARADFRGDLRASILAALAHDPGAGSSELHLARCSGGSRSQVRNALDNLELTGKVSRVRDHDERRTRITAHAPHARLQPSPSSSTKRRSA